MENTKLNNRQLKRSAGGANEDWRVVEIDAGKCIACAACLDSCPNDALHWEGGTIAVNENCIGCGNCLNECPMEAIHRK